MRQVARKAGLGKLRDRVGRSQRWIAAPVRRLKDLDVQGACPRNAIAITFDDGPHPEVTPKLLEVLESHSVPATFFMCGLPASRHPGLVESVASAGHSIGGHTWDHQQIPTLSDTQWQHQVDDTHDLLAELSGKPVRWFRPPRGHDTRSSRARLKKRGIATVLWSASGRDWRLDDPQDVADSVLGDLDQGGIVLLHDAIAEVTMRFGEHTDSRSNQMHTVRAVEILMNAVARRGLVPISLDSITDAHIAVIGRPRVTNWRRD